MSAAGLDVRGLAETVLAAAGEEVAEALVRTERSGFARFAASEIHQPTLVEDATVQLRVLRGQRSGTASTNRLDDSGIADLVRRAQDAAESSTPDDALPGLAPPLAAPAIEGWDAATATLDGEGQALLALAAIDASSLPLYGFVTSGATEVAVASTTGLRAHQRTTDATVRVIAANAGASGYAERTAWSAARIDPAATAREAVAKAERTRSAGTLERGTYRAVLEPYALGELLQWLAFDSFGALGLLDGASFLGGRLGERLLDPAVTIFDDALDPAGLPKAVDFEGVPKQRVALIEAGVARGVVWDRLTAARAGEGHASTGHALPAAQRTWGPFVSALSMAGGDAPSLEALAEAVGDGIHVTRLHYLSVVSPRDGIITGTTRDGTFRIRGGRIAEPLVNLRFTVSVPELLGEVLGLTRTRLLTSQSDFYDERFAFGALVPGLATGRFAVTGTGSSPGL